jgi:hypothetical protein
MFAQIIGFAGMTAMVLSFQCKDTKKLFLFQLLGSIFYGIQFFLLGAYTGAASQIVGICRNFILASRGKWAQRKIWTILLCSAQVAVTVLTWKNPFSLLPAVAFIALTLGGSTGNAQSVRIANMFINSPCWFVYDLYSFSVAGMITEALIQLSTLIFIHRYGWKALNTKQD